jgi:hypothetical protein
MKTQWKPWMALVLVLPIVLILRDRSEKTFVVSPEKHPEPVITVRTATFPRKTASIIHEPKRQTGRTPEVIRERTVQSPTLLTHDPEMSEKTKTLELQSKRLDYKVTFDGNLECEAGPCAEGHVTVSAMTSRQNTFEKSVRTSADGKFSVTFDLKEYPAEQIDWQIISEAQFRRAMAGGRVILQDDTHINITRTMRNL